MGLLAVLRAGAAEVPNFDAVDLAGHNYELHRAGGKAVVLFFTGTGCPIARKSSPKLHEIQRRYAGRGVTLWGVDSYPEDAPEAIRHEWFRLGLWQIPCLRDPKQAIALSLGIQRTTEVVVIAVKDWSVVYHGAIDDQYSEGTEKPKAENHFLRQALDELLSDHAITTPSTPAHGCRFTFAEGPETPSYAKDVAPVLKEHCTDCHRDGGIGPWAMDGHGRVKNNARMIEEVLLTHRMPPWDPDPEFGRFSNACDLTREESQLLLRWIKAGAPRGGEADPLAMPPPQPPEWPQGRPDVVLKLPEPQHIPATGVLEYRHIRIHSPFTNEVWLSGMDIKPGNREVVHHVILYAKWPGSTDDGTGNGVHICGWAPGFPPVRFPVGVGRQLPAGTEFNAEVHYTTCGTPQTDQSEIAFYLAPGPQPRAAEVRRAVEPDVNIPPGSDDARHVAVYGFQKPATLYSLMPHMHFRGKSMRYDLLLPDGRRETLLNVPRYDFNWQLGYTLAQPKLIPAGAWLMVTGSFDNSSANPANPDATKRVHFGPQSWDEMFIGFFEAADEPGPARPAPAPANPILKSGG